MKAEHQPFAWRWKHVDDDSFYYGGELPRSLRPYAGQTLIGNYFIEPMFGQRLLQALIHELDVVRRALFQAQEAAKERTAAGEALRAEAGRAWAEVDLLAKQIGDLTTARLQEEQYRANIMGRIAIALLGEKNNVSDNVVVAAATRAGCRLQDAENRAWKAEDLASSLAIQMKRDPAREAEVERLAKIEKAARELSANAEEYALDCGLGRGAPNSYWEDLDEALDFDEGAVTKSVS